MEIREGLNKRNGVMTGMAIVAIVLSLAFIGHHLLRGRHPAVPYFPDKEFYTCDDGATLFADSIGKVPPFDHDGRPAVRAYVFSCDGGKHQWVQYLEKYSDESITAWEAPNTGGLPKGSSPASSGLLIKKAGSGDWISENSQAAGKILDAQPPEGMGTGTPAAVNP